jgi:hypothetical protein
MWRVLQNSLLILILAAPACIQRVNPLRILCTCLTAALASDMHIGSAALHIPCFAVNVYYKNSPITHKHI